RRATRVTGRATTRLAGAAALRAVFGSAAFVAAFGCAFAAAAFAAVVFLAAGFAASLFFGGRGAEPPVVVFAIRPSSPSRSSYAGRGSRRRGSAANAPHRRAAPRGSSR